VKFLKKDSLYYRIQKFLKKFTAVRTAAQGGRAAGWT
jgi:hypothetical protein